MPKIISLIFIALLFCSCSLKNDNMVFAKRDTILGKWQLFETCISPGNACVLKKIKDGVIIEFKANGEYLVSNTNKGDGAFECGGKYQVIEFQTNPTQQAIEFRPSCNKALWTHNLVFNENNTININPLCIEECRYSYKPVD
jgi:hypothetical protein